MKKIWKILLVAAAIITVLIISVAWYLSIHWKSVLDRELRQYVQEGSDSLYTLSYGQIDLNLLSGSMAIHDVALLPDSGVYQLFVKEQRAPAVVYDAKMSSIRISGLKIWQYFMSKEVDAGTFTLVDPIISITEDRRSIDTTPRRSLYASISRNIRRIDIGRIDLAHTWLTYTQIGEDSSKVITSLKELNMEIRQLDIDSISQQDPTRFLYARSFKMSLEKWEYRTPDSLYWLRVNGIQYSATGRSLEIDELRLDPRYNEQDFDRQIQTQQDRFELVFRKIRGEGVPFFTLLHQQVMLRSMSIDGGLLHVYRNRNLPMPAGNKLGQFPNQLLAKLKMPLRLDSLLARNIDVSYTERGSGNGETGTVKFQKAGGLFTNITNLDSMVARDPHCRIDLHAILMQRGKLKAHFDFVLGAQNGAFYVSGQLNDMDGKEFNTITKPLGMIEIRSAQISELSFNIQGNERRAAGTLKFLYSNLKIAMLRNETGADGQKKKKGLASLLANLLAIKNENPSPGEAVRIVKPQFTRDIHKSFFNLVWKTIFTGVKETAGTPMLDMMESRKK